MSDAKKLLGSTKNQANKVTNGENAPQLEITVEVILAHSYNPL